jgi:hypothetical protein
MHGNSTSSLKNFRKWSRKEKKDFLCKNYEMVLYFIFEKNSELPKEKQMGKEWMYAAVSDIEEMCENKLEKNPEDKLIELFTKIIEANGDYIFGRGIYSDVNPEIVFKTNTGRRGEITSPGNDVIKTNTGRRGIITSPGEGGRKRRKTIAARKRDTSKRNTRKNR